MKRLLIMRHAKSDQDTSGADIDRSLSARGRRDAPRMGNWLQQQNFMPDRILCSPARRTRETAELVLQSMSSGAVDIQYEPGLYEADLDDLMSILEQHSAAAGTLMLIAHNPGVDSLLQYLSRQSPPRAASGKLMTTAAIAVLEWASGGVPLAAASGDLVALARPRELPAV